MTSMPAWDSSIAALAIVSFRLLFCSSREPSEGGYLSTVGPFNAPPRAHPRHAPPAPSSVVSAVTLVDSARTSSAWAVNASNCFRQWAVCNSTISERFLAPANLLARSKPEFMFRWAMSMILRLNAAAPWPAASKVLSNVEIDASRNGGLGAAHRCMRLRLDLLAYLKSTFHGVSM